MPPDSAKEIGERIKAARERAGLTQSQLAERIGLKGGYQHIGKWERGVGTPRAENLERVEEVLGVRLTGPSELPPSPLKLGIGLDTIRSPIVREVLREATKPGAFRSFGKEPTLRDIWSWIYDKCLRMGASVAELREADPIRDESLEPTGNHE